MPSFQPKRLASLKQAASSMRAWRSVDSDGPILPTTVMRASWVSACRIQTANRRQAEATGRGLGRREPERRARGRLRRLARLLFDRAAGERHVDSFEEAADVERLGQV